MFKARKKRRSPAPRVLSAARGFQYIERTMKSFDAVLVKPEQPGTWTYLVVPFSVPEAFGTRPQVRVRLERDMNPRRDSGLRLAPPAGEVPDEMQKPLAAHYEKLSYSHRREYARWVADAKKEETRARRAAKAVEMLRAGKSLK